jgi:hypothetical protein
MWHKAQAQPSQGVADQTCVGAFPKTIMSTCPGELVLKPSIDQRQCKKGTWLPGRPIKWAPHAQFSATALPYSTYKYHGGPPLTESVKGVRFSPL